MKQQLNTQQECLLYFEKLRWGKKVVCPYCFSDRTHPAKNEQGRHFCYNCVKSFSVLVGTVFEDTRLSLPIWIKIIKQMLKSKNIIPAKSLAADFSITVKTAWLTAMKIRCAMIDNETSLQGLLSMDENYINRKLKSKKLGKYFPGSEEKVYKVNKLSNSQHLKSFGELTHINLTGVLKHYIKYDENSASTTLRSYETMDKAIEAISQKHGEQNKSDKKQNMKDNYWGFIKNGIYNESKSLSAKYLPFYLLEYEYKFKRKGFKNIFPQFMKDVFSDHAKAIDVDSPAIKKQVAYA
jgi:transposase-like protein